MAVRGAGGRAVSGGGMKRVGSGVMGGMVGQPSGKTARMRRDTDAGRDTERHLVGDFGPTRGQSFGGTAGGTAVQIKKG